MKLILHSTWTNRTWIKTWKKTCISCKMIFWIGQLHYNLGYVFVDSWKLYTVCIYNACHTLACLDDYLISIYQHWQKEEVGQSYFDPCKVLVLFPNLEVLKVCLWIFIQCRCYRGTLESPELQRMFLGCGLPKIWVH